MSTEQQHLESVIDGLEAQRARLGDTVIDAALEPLRNRLAALAGAEQTLKQVTIVFLDVVGSTALAQRLDPEDIQATMDGLLARCTANVQKHGGKVLQYAGDSLLAVFGADTAREDDPERAVQAALALLAEGRAEAGRVLEKHGHAGFDVRVGVHTGPVLLGGGVDADHTIRGAAVHAAARLEQTAPPGGLRISHDTYRHVRGVFDVEAQPPLTVKGIDEPIATYLVQRAKPRAFRVATRGIEGVEIRMVGRDAELEQLQEAFKRLGRDGRLVSVTIVAEAGLGKSRLLYEFENWAEAQPEPFLVFQARAHPQTQGQPYGLLRELLTWRLQIADSDGLAPAREKFESAVAPLFESDDGAELAYAHAHVLGHLIGLDFGASRHIRGIRDDVQQIRNRGFHAAAQLLRRFAARHAAPVVVLLDDLHFADDASLDFLRYLGATNRDVPMLVISLTRPSLFERRPDFAGLTEDDARIQLAPLDKGASRLLANELLKQLDEIPAALRELITGGAEGNPFYMEELVKMLVDEGAIRTSAERWSVVPDRLVTTHVPQTLTGVLQARLDGLAPAEKRALQQASVVGFVFWDEALAAIDAAAPAQLPSLVRRELAMLRPDAALDGVREYAFKHHLLHHVTYDTVLKRARREGHAKVASWLARRSSAWPTALLRPTAEHYERAGEPSQACEFYARSAEHARDRFAHAAALADVESALALLDEIDAAANAVPDAASLRLRWRLLEVRERIHDLQGRRDDQASDLDAMGRLADALDDDRIRGVAALRRSTLAMRTGNYRQQEVSARQAIAHAQRVDDAVLRLRAQLTLVLGLNYLGNSAEAQSLAQPCVAECRLRGERGLESHFLNALSIIASMREDTVRAIELSRQQLPIDRDLGNPRDEAITHGNLGSSLVTLGAHAEGGEHLRAGLRLARSVGDRESEFVPLYNLSVLALRTGDHALALVHAQGALDVAVEVANPPLEVLGWCALGNAELAVGRHASAETAFERARTIAQALETGGLAAAEAMRHEADAGLARVALARGDLWRALGLVEQLIPVVANAALQNAEAPFLVYNTCHQVLQRCGDARATEVLAKAHAMLQEKAATLSDATLRTSFLSLVPEHREIVAAWQTAGVPSGAS